MVKQRRRTAGGGPVHSLTDKLEQRCVDLILDFRRMPLGDDDDENHTGEDAMPPSPEHPEQDDTWQHADLMAEYVRSVEASTRRMKFGIVQAVVESAIARIRRADKEDALVLAPDSTSASADTAPSPSDSEADLDPNAGAADRSGNAMNKTILRTYATNNAVPVASPDNATPVAVPGASATAPTSVTAPTSAPSSTAPSAPTDALSADRPAKRRRGGAGKKSSSSPATADDHAPPNVRYADLGGIDKCIDEVRELIEAPIAHPEIFRHLNIAPTRGVLLHGPPGCGKTQLARAVAGELGVPFIQISAPSVVKGMSGESEKMIRDVFAEAAELAPCLLFIDEIDAITPKRENAQREMERRIVAQLLTCMDDLCLENTNQKPVIVIGATNRPDSLDAALRRAGRFDREISMGIPDERAREQILRVLTAKLRMSGEVDFHELAKVTPGYVGADLNALITTAGMFAVKRIFGFLARCDVEENGVMSMSGEHATIAADMDVDGEGSTMAVAASTTTTTLSAATTTATATTSSDIALFLERHRDPLTTAQLEPLAVETADFQLALKKVQPSSKREGFATVPDVSWSDIGALEHVRDELRMTIVEPIKDPELFAKVGISNPAGVLLWGPPGCGKTLLAKAVANESHCNFISVKGPELLNKYVGESERGVRQVFARARASSPCVIFFDELDALCPRRGGGSDSQTSERVVNQLLTEMDGLEGRSSVFIIAATNRPDIIDRAILRPGRLDKLLYVQLPSAEERLQILLTLAQKAPIADDVDMDAVARHPRCSNFSGADLSALIREAGLACLRENLLNNATSGVKRDPPAIARRHFETAFERVSPSVTEKDLHSYEALRRKLNSNEGKKSVVPASPPTTPSAGGVDIEAL